MIDWLKAYAWMFGLLGLGGVAGAIIAALRWRWDARKHKNQQSTIPLAQDAKASIENSGNSTSTAIGNTLTVNIPAIAPPPPFAPALDVVPVAVELIPWRGKGDKMYLIVTNRGERQQAFQGQCRILGRRNDKNPTQFSAFDLQWQYGGQSYTLLPGQHGNLLIASAGEHGNHGWQWMQLEPAVGQPKPQRSDWQHGDPLPEYDVEVSILGDRASKAYSERFTVRAGIECAMEMYQRYVRIDAPVTKTEVKKREYLVKGTIRIPRAKVQLWVYAGEQWHPQGNVVVSGNSFEGTCWFGDKNSTRGEYKIRAVAGGDLEIRKYKILPESGVQSEDVVVYLNRTLPQEMQSDIVGEIESARFTIRGEGIDHGKPTHSTNVCVRLRVTNREKAEATIKNAELEITIEGKTYHGVKMSLCDPREGADLLSKITAKNPLRHGVATTGALEFWIQGLKSPDNVVEADLSVALTDEFDSRHLIHKKGLRIA